MALNPKRTIAELKELRALTADENGAQGAAPWRAYRLRPERGMARWLSEYLGRGGDFAPDSFTISRQTTGHDSIGRLGR
jgi:hypothetical protein